MNLDQFIRESKAQVSVSKYGGADKWKDGGFLGQCVSFVNQYCWRVLGVPAGSWGDAKDWATSKEVEKYFDKVSSPKAGDIGVSGPTATNPYGHIWVYTSPTTLIEQNGKSVLKISEGSTYFKPIAILRKKGSSPGGVNMDSEDAKEVGYRLGLYREPEDDNVWRAHVGKKPSDVARNVRGSEEWLNNNHILKVAYPESQRTIKRLEDQIKQLEGQKPKGFEEVGTNSGLYQKEK